MTARIQACQMKSVYAQTLQMQLLQLEQAQIGGEKGPQTGHRERAALKVDVMDVACTG